MGEFNIKLPLTLAQRNSIKEKLCDLKSALKSILHLRNTFGDRIEIKDEVLVWEGEGENRKLIFKTKGHIVNQGLIEMTNLMAVSDFTNAAYTPSAAWTIRLGTGAGVTAPATTALIAESAVAPSAIIGATSNPAVGSYRVQWTATWNAGTLGAITVTEFGLKLYMDIVLRAFRASLGVPAANKLASRISSTDGDFVAFVVNVANNLVIDWRFTFTFV